MNFQPLSENQLADRKLLKAGVYNFKIIEAHERISNNGNDMFEIKLELSSNGSEPLRVLTDYLLPKGARADKLLHCCAASGILDNYRRGCLSHDDFVGKRGRLRLGIEKKKAFPDRNVVEDYVSAENGSQPGLKPLSAA